MNWAGLSTLHSLAGKPLAMSALHAGALVGLFRCAANPAFGDSIRHRARVVVDSSFRPFVVEAGDAVYGQQISPGRTTEAGNVAIVPVIGPIASDVSSVSDSDGARFGSTYDEIQTGIEAALANPKFDAVLLYVDSPGGEAIPSYPVVDFLMRNRGGSKPIGAFVAGLCGSAALHLATACTPGHLMLTRAGLMDSIGTMLPLFEESKALEKDGITVNLILSGTKHAAGASFKVMSPEERNRLQGEVNALGSRFVADVAAGRGVQTDRVKQWAASSWIGQAAVDSGLADAVVSDVNEAVSRLSAAAANPSNKGPANMDPKKTTETPAATTTASATTVATPAATAASGAGAATIDQIKAICGGDKAFAFDMLEKGASLDQVRDAWIANLTTKNTELQAQVQSGNTKLNAVANLGAPAIQAKPANTAGGTGGAPSDGKGLTDGDPGDSCTPDVRCEAIVKHMLNSGGCKSRATAMNHLIKNHAATYRAAKDGGWGERRAAAVLKPLGLI